MINKYIFKGKREDNGKWVEGDLMQWGDEIVRICVDTGNDEKTAITVIPETVGQCTGLKDKNGKWIFAGDIVESRASENQECWKRWIVTSSDGSFCFEREITRKRKYKHVQNLLCTDEIELYGLNVIGNIHDNPELLEAATND